MNKTEKNKQLIHLTNKFIEDIQKYKDSIPASEQKDAGDLLNVMNSALYRLGVRKQKVKATAPKDAFAKKKVNLHGKIENDAPKNAFEKKPLKSIEEKSINNKAPNNAFKKKELIPEQHEAKVKFEEEIKKTGNKWNKRLSKDKKTRINALFANNFSVEQISNELWIEEKVIAKHLKIKTPSVVIADNTGNSKDEFIQEVKEAKENG